jgi:hypothetical protein
MPNKVSGDEETNKAREISPFSEYSAYLNRQRRHRELVVLNISDTASRNRKKAMIGRLFGHKTEC